MMMTISLSDFFLGFGCGMILSALFQALYLLLDLTRNSNE